MKTLKTVFGILAITMSCCLALRAQTQSFLTNGLVSYYPFGGNARDAAGTNNGTLLGATLTTDRFGNANSAYFFNGSSWISTSQYRLLDGATNATISAWVTITGTG